MQHEQSTPGGAGLRLLEEFYLDHGPALVRYLVGLTRSRAAAEDLAQQLWLRLLEAAKAGRAKTLDDEEFRAYLFTSARNLFIDEHLRKHSGRRTLNRDPQLLERDVNASGRHESHEERPDRSAESEQLRALVWAAISSLPGPQRNVVSLWLDGASITAMSAATGAPRDTVLSRKKYALKRLRPLLSTSLGFSA